MKHLLLLVLFALISSAFAVEYIDDALVLNSQNSLQEKDIKSDDYITGIEFSNGKCKENFFRTTDDLNKGAGGDYIYMCAKRLGNDPSDSSVLTDLQVVTGSESLDIGACPKGYTIIDQDLNKGAKGRFIYLCAKYGEGTPVVAIRSVHGRNAFSRCASQGFNKFSNVDLNMGAGGDFIYLCWQTHGKKVTNVKVTNMEYDLRALSQDDASIKGVDEITVRAGSGESETNGMSGEYSVTESNSWETSAGASITVGTEFEVGVPMVSAAKVSVSATASFTYTSTKGREKTEVRQYSLNCKAEPYTIKKCSALYRSATISIPYKATKITSFADGTSEQTEFNGIFKGVTASRLEVQEEVTPLPRPEKNKKKSNNRRTKRK